MLCFLVCFSPLVSVVVGLQLDDYALYSLISTRSLSDGRIIMFM